MYENKNDTFKQGFSPRGKQESVSTSNYRFFPLLTLIRIVCCAIQARCRDSFFTCRCTNATPPPAATASRGKAIKWSAPNPDSTPIETFSSPERLNPGIGDKPTSLNPSNHLSRGNCPKRTFFLRAFTCEFALFCNFRWLVKDF